MPSKYWDSLEAAPAPAEGSGVILEERPVETMAVSCFGGYALGPVVAKKMLGTSEKTGTKTKQVKCFTH